MRLANGYLHMPFGTVPLRACATLYMASKVGTLSQQMTQSMRLLYRFSTNHYRK